MLNIEELEKGSTTFSNCEKLASLYIVRDHYNMPETLSELDTEVLNEAKDILPSYEHFCEIKRKYQLGEVSEKAVSIQMQNVVKELKEFIVTLYSSSDMQDERDMMNALIYELIEMYGMPQGESEDEMSLEIHK